MAWVLRAQRGDPPTVQELTPVLGPGSLVDRFIVLDAAGEGAMGAVHIAHDPTLDRKVALKMLHGPQAESENARNRLRREAQALAKLSSRNLVGVFDVLRWHGQLVVAMEYVEGTNLRHWFREGPRPWRQVVQVFLQAGRGLADMHAAGMVHRDFKPENVLVSIPRDAPPSTVGVVKVADLGLVASVGAAGGEGMADTSATSELLTSPGSILGTPAYMAPEQLRGESVNELSDQFAFCVALFEGLEGRRPFEPYTLRELLALKGVRPQRSLTRSVPAWLKRIVRRGLEPDPAARFPSMDHLLSELARERQARLARRVAIAGAGVVLLGLAILTGLRRPPNPCTEEMLSREWSPSAHVALQDLGLAPAELARLERALDDYVRQWDENVKRRCNGLELSGPPPPDLVPFFACLAEKRRGFHQLLVNLRRGDEELRGLGADVVSLLPPMSSCVAPRDVVHLEQLPLVNHEPRLRLLEAHKLLEAGDFDGTRALLDAALTTCRPSDVAVEAEILLVQSRLEAAQSHPFAAQDLARRAALASVRHPRHVEGVVESWWQLALFAATDTSMPVTERQRTVAWQASLASAELGQLPLEARRLQAMREAVTAEHSLLRGDSEGAVIAAERALKFAQQTSPLDPLLVNDARLRLARAALVAQKPDVARASLEVVLRATPTLTVFQRRASLGMLVDALEALGATDEASLRRQEAARLGNGASQRAPQ